MTRVQAADTTPVGQAPSRLQGTLRISAIDANSGVTQLQVSDNQEFVPFTQFAATGPTTELPWELQPSGEVYVRALDRAGNRSGAKEPPAFVVFLPCVSWREP